jgi:hypothetical protein
MQSLDVVGDNPALSGGVHSRSQKLASMSGISVRQRWPLYLAFRQVPAKFRMTASLEADRLFYSL